MEPEKNDETLRSVPIQVLALLLLFIEAAGVWRHLRRHGDYLLYARAWTARLFRCFRAWCSQRGGQDDPAAQTLEQAIQERQLRILKHALLPFSLISSAHVAVLLLMSLSSVERWMSPGQDVVFLIYNAVTVCQFIVPGLMTKKTMSFWYSVHMLLMALLVLLLPPLEPGTDRIFVIILLANVAWGIVCPSLCLVVLWSFIASTAMLIQQLQFPLEGIEVIRTFFRPASEFALAVTLIVWVRVLIREAEKHATTVTKSKIDLNAAISLLNSVCDAVLELNADLRFGQHVPKFADMMMRGSSLPLTGRSLLDFMFVDEDRQRLQQNMSLPLRAGLPPVAEVFRARMRDSLANCIDVDIYHVGFLDFEGRPRHLVGISEYHGDPVPARTGGCRNAAPCRGGVAGSAVPGALPLPSEDVAVKIDMSKDGFPLVWWSIGFGILVGQVLRGDRFLKFLDPREQSHLKFAQWLQKVLNMARARGPAQVEHRRASHRVRLPSHRVRLRPQGENRASSIRATCRVVFQEAEEEGEEEEEGDDGSGEGGSSSSNSGSGSATPGIVHISLSGFRRRGSSTWSESSSAGGSSGSNDDSSLERGTPGQTGAAHSGHIVPPTTLGVSLSL